MPKKNFKNSPALAFIGGSAIEDTEDTPGTLDTLGTEDTLDTSAPAIPDEKKEMPAYYRMNLKLKGEFKEYLELTSWRARKSVTQYINDLIAADRERNGGN